MYLQTKKKNKFAKIPKCFYIETLYCLLCSPDFALLHRQNLGKKFLAPPDQILDPLLYVKVCTMLLFCALSPKNPLGGKATVPLTHIRLQAEYFIASLVGNLIPPISTLNHKTFNLTSILLYFVHFLLFFLFTLLITQLFCWIFSNEKCICGPIVKRLNGQSVTLHSHCYCRSPERKRYFHSDFHSIKIKTRKNFINFIE